MKKCETFEDLQELGAEKIHERTHISRDKAELILDKSFGGIGKVQFMGFISILEREYGIDLSSVRQEYLAFRNEHDHNLSPKQSVILQPASNARKKWMLAGAAVIAALIAGGYAVQNLRSNAPEEGVMQLPKVETEAASAVAEENATTASDANESEAVGDANVTEPAVETNATRPTVSERFGVENGLTIHPVYKVWIGMIDLANGEKRQQITSDPIVVDTAKNCLIVLGHGRVEIESGSRNTLMKEKDTVYFVCEGGELKRLTKEEFIERNGGKSW